MHVQRTCSKCIPFPRLPPNLHDLSRITPTNEPQNPSILPLHPTTTSIQLSYPTIHIHHSSISSTTTDINEPKITMTPRQPFPAILTNFSGWKSSLTCLSPFTRLPFRILLPQKHTAVIAVAFCILCFFPFLPFSLALMICSIRLNSIYDLTPVKSSAVQCRVSCARGQATASTPMPEASQVRTEFRVQTHLPNSLSFSRIHKPNQSPDQDQP